MEMKRITLNFDSFPIIGVIFYRIPFLTFRGYMSHTSGGNNRRRLAEISLKWWSWTLKVLQTVASIFALILSAISKSSIRTAFHYRLIIYKHNRYVMWTLNNIDSCTTNFPDDFYVTIVVAIFLISIRLQRNCGWRCSQTNLSNIYIISLYSLSIPLTKWRNKINPLVTLTS